MRDARPTTKTGILNDRGKIDKSERKLNVSLKLANKHLTEINKDLKFVGVVDLWGRFYMQVV